jgi:hypothetical protein
MRPGGARRQDGLTDRQTVSCEVILTLVPWLALSFPTKLTTSQGEGKFTCVCVPKLHVMKLSGGREGKAPRSLHLLTRLLNI